MNGWHGSRQYGLKWLLFPRKNHSKLTIVLEKNDCLSGFGEVCQLKGSLVTRACRSLSRTLIYIRLSIFAKTVRTYPSPMALPSVGDCVPDVTFPMVIPEKSLIS